MNCAVLPKAKLKNNGVRVLSARENITDDASGILDEGVLESMAEYYSAELSQKINRGMEINAQKCLSNGSNPGLGFKVDKDRRFYVDEEESCQTYFNKKGKVGGVTKAPELVRIKPSEIRYSLLTKVLSSATQAYSARCVNGTVSTRSKTSQTVCT